MEVLLRCLPCALIDCLLAQSDRLLGQQDKLAHNLDVIGAGGWEGDKSPAGATAGNTASLAPQRAAKGEIPVGPRNPGWRSAAGLPLRCAEQVHVPSLHAAFSYMHYDEVSRRLFGLEAIRWTGVTDGH